MLFYLGYNLPLEIACGVPGKNSKSRHASPDHGTQESRFQIRDTEVMHLEAAASEAPFAWIVPDGRAVKASCSCLGHGLDSLRMIELLLRGARGTNASPFSVFTTWAPTRLCWIVAASHAKEENWSSIRIHNKDPCSPLTV